MLRSFKTTLVLFFALGAAGVVQAQTDMCRLTVSSVQKNPFQASSRELVGEFPMTFENDKLAKELRHEESGIQIFMGVEILEGMSKTRVIRLGISFQREGDDSAFEALDGVEARTFYDRNWRALVVSKNIQKTNRIYTFEFSCEKATRKKR